MKEAYCTNMSSIWFLSPSSEKSKVSACIACRKCGLVTASRQRPANTQAEGRILQDPYHVLVLAHFTWWACNVCMRKSVLQVPSSGGALCWEKRMGSPRTWRRGSSRTWRRGRSRTLEAQCKVRHSENEMNSWMLMMMMMLTYLRAAKTIQEAKVVGRLV